MVIALLLLLVLGVAFSFRLNSPLSRRYRLKVSDCDIKTETNKRRTDRTSQPIPTETDIAVIGSGLAGLSCAALLAHVGYDVTVLESHDAPGGCAHTWERLGYHFESGPSLYSGFSIDKSPNPLKNIFQIIGEDCEWLTYDRWGTSIPEGKFAAKIGPDEFNSVLLKYGGEEAVQDWKKLMNYVTQKGGLSEAAQATPSLALREDIGVIVTLAKYFRRTITTLSKGGELNESFAKIQQSLDIKSPFVLHWLDMLCFLLRELPASGTLNAVIAYMLADWYRPGAGCNFPKGGSGSIVDALVRGVEKHQGKGRVLLRKHVTEVIVDNGVANGVVVRDEITKQLHIVNAKVAVVSNIDMYQTRKLVPKGKHAEFDTVMDTMLSKTPKLASFIHLHAGIDATGLPTTPSADFPTQWAVVRDWEMKGGGVEAPRNVVLVSMPSLIDPTLAPPNKHVLHAYTPATEPYEWWEGLDRRSQEYQDKKAEAADFLWKAVEEYIPDARQRSDKRVEQIGTPLTHERFLRRSYGTYGPRVVAGEQTLPGHKTAIKGLWMTGDFTFPGIGVPAAASSGAIVANSIMPLGKHLKILDQMNIPDYNP